jgi:hypothetical protein
LANNAFAKPTHYRQNRRGYDEREAPILLIFAGICWDWLKNGLVFNLKIDIIRF